MDIDRLYDSGYAKLHHAGKKGNPELCMEHHSNGTNPNVRSDKLIKVGPYFKDWYWEPGETPLILALKEGHEECARLLIEYGADASLNDQYSFGVIHAAVLSGISGIFELLINKGADINLFCYYRYFDEEGLGWYFNACPLHMASARYDKKTVEELIKNGADLNNCWSDKRTPIFYAAAYGNRNAIEVLCKHGANLNEREEHGVYGGITNRTPLHYAAMNGHEKAYNKMVTLGADELLVEFHQGLNAKQMASWIK